MNKSNNRRLLRDVIYDSSSLKLALSNREYIKPIEHCHCKLEMSICRHPSQNFKTSDGVVFCSVQCARDHFKDRTVIVIGSSRSVTITPTFENESGEIYLEGDDPGKWIMANEWQRKAYNDTVGQLKLGFLMAPPTTQVSSKNDGVFDYMVGSDWLRYWLLNTRTGNRRLFWDAGTYPNPPMWRKRLK